MYREEGEEVEEAGDAGEEVEEEEEAEEEAGRSSTSDCTFPGEGSSGSKRPKVFNTFSCFYGGWHLLFFIVRLLFPSPSRAATRIRPFNHAEKKERVSGRGGRRNRWNGSKTAVREHAVTREKETSQTRERPQFSQTFSDVRLGGPREKNPINQ